MRGAGRNSKEFLSTDVIVSRGNFLRLRLRGIEQLCKRKTTNGI